MYLGMMMTMETRTGKLGKTGIRSNSKGTKRLSISVLFFCYSDCSIKRRSKFSDGTSSNGNAYASSNALAIILTVPSSRKSVPDVVG